MNKSGSMFMEHWLIQVTRHPIRVLVACVAAAVVAGAAAVNLLGVDSDPIAMLDEELPFRQTDERMREEFPNLDNTLLAVIEAPTPEQAALAARRVERALTERPDVIRSVNWPAASPFFARNGLLFLPLEQLEALDSRLVAAQPLIGRLARQTNAVALFELLEQIAERGGSDARDFDADSVFGQVGETIESSMAGTPAMLSWQHLLSGEDSRSVPAREVLLIDPVLDHGRVLAARSVMAEMKDLRRELDLDRGPVRLVFTGSTALRYEEMKSVIEGAGLTGMLALIMVSAVMLAGLRSIPLSLIALANLALGLIITAGFAAVAIGRVNLISVSFVVLYIGLGVNYAVHYLLRYREIVLLEPPGAVAAARATIGAGRFLLYPLVLSAITTALGFFAFVPTAFSGIAELGLIAGAAMMITLALSYTALPAMLALFKPRVTDSPPIHERGWRRGLEWPLRFRRTVLVMGALLVIAALPALPDLRFDSDPLNVRDPGSESVIAIRSLLAEDEAGYRNIQVLLEPGSKSEPVRRRLDALPTVARAVSLQSLVPDNQDEKLLIIDELRWVLGPDIVGADWQVEPVAAKTLAERAAALAAALGQYVEGPTAADLAASLERLRRQLTGNAGEDLATQVNQALTAGMQPTLGRLSSGLQVTDPVTVDDFPAWLVDQWRGRGGTQLLQVYPAVDVLDFARQNEFTGEVLSVAGNRATGAPVIQHAAGQAITEAFRQALAWAVIGIALVLLVTLRQPLAVAKVMAPLALGGLLTVAAMTWLGIHFNFANVVALPLLLGVAVDNGIHLVARHRAGLLPDGNVLRTATARAIVVGAMITAGGFGNLAFSPHSGTASLGIILALGLSLMVIATLVFLPALLGRRDY